MGKKEILNFHDLTASWPKKGDLHGMLYAVAALSEGYCPTHKTKVGPVPKKRGRDLEPFPSQPRVHAFCTECKVVYTVGEATWNESPWLMMSDRSAGCLRTLIFNPAPEVDDDEDFYTMITAEEQT